MVKEYRTLQVEYAAGKYGGFSMIASFMYFLTDSFLYALLSLFAFYIFLYFDKPLKYVLSSEKILGSSFIVLSLITIIGPMLIFNLVQYPENELIAFLLLALGCVSIFIFLWRYYTHSKLEQLGWINISGRWN